MSLREIPSLHVIQMAAFSLFMLGRDDEAEEMVDKALANPLYDDGEERYAVITVKARILRSRGNLEEAITLFESIAPVKDEPHLHATHRRWWELAELYERVGRTDKALECDRKVRMKAFALKRGGPPFVQNETGVERIIFSHR